MIGILPHALKLVVVEEKMNDPPQMPLILQLISYSFPCQARVAAAAHPSGFKQIQTAAPGKEKLCFPGAAFRLAVTLLAFYSAEQLTGV